VETGTSLSFQLGGAGVDLNNWIPPEARGLPSSPHRNEGASSGTLQRDPQQEQGCGIPRDSVPKREVDGKRLRPRPGEQKSDIVATELVGAKRSRCQNDYPTDSIA